MSVFNAPSNVPREESRPFFYPTLPLPGRQESVYKFRHSWRNPHHCERAFLPESGSRRVRARVVGISLARFDSRHFFPTCTFGVEPLVAVPPPSHRQTARTSTEPLDGTLPSLPITIEKRKYRTNMSRITDKIAALRPGEPFHSLEFFPPKTSMVSSS